ncbi:MAG TPA: ABC transporter permease [Bryobacteraceae bacterium]|jgi:putative ABC transport system permease protein|nr:ABC transporter permease [Bryobacteraceae bacterium]
MLRAFLRNLFRKHRNEQDLDDELRDYLEQTAAEHIRRGMTRPDAAVQARRDLGGMEQVKERVRDARAGASLDTFLQDARFAIRSLRKNPSFAVVAILTLALGIGANTTIFSVVNGVLLKPLPYPHPERLVTLWETGKTRTSIDTVSPSNFYDWRAQNSSFESMAAIDPYPDFILTGTGEPHRLAGAEVTADFFPMLGVRMALGRGFRAAEEKVVVLSYATWVNHFGARPDLVGQQIRLNDEGYTVTGVLPRDFSFVSKASDFQMRSQFDLWTNMGLTSPPAAWMRGTHPLCALGRLKPGIPLQTAAADLNRIAQNLQRMYPNDDKDSWIAAIPMSEHVIANVRTALFTLLAAVGMVLLIACANIANLLLTRAAARRREMALRAALGASRRRLVQQLLTESTVLAAAGGALGFALAFFAVPLVVRYLPADLPRTSEIGVDGRVLAFAGLVMLLTGAVFGLVPLTQFRGFRLSGRGVTAGQSRLRNALIVGQVSVALVLLIGAGLMTRSLHALLEVPPGFQAEHVLSARLSLPPRYSNNMRFGIGQHRQISAFQRDLVERVRALPGVQSAAFAAHLPLGGTTNVWSFTIDGRPPMPPGEFNLAHYRPVTAGYFETIGIPIHEGRSFESRDDEDHALVMIVNESMAHTFWGAQDPIGQRVSFGPHAWRTIVGVVGDVHHQSLNAAPVPEMYVPYGQVPNVESHPILVVRALGDPLTLTGAVRKAVAAIDPEVPMDQTTTMQQLVYGSVGESRFRASVISLFAVLALLVACIGLYGVMSYLVSQRTREFGIRMAIGASRGAVLRQVLGQGARLAAIGVCFGLVAAVFLGRLIATLLFGVTPLDAATLAEVSLLVGAVALLASYIPARRAANADPMESLRYE